MKHFILIVCIAISIVLKAQPKVNSVLLVGDRKLSLSLAQAVAKDNLNNTVVVGRFQDTCDFDNGPGTAELVSVRGAIFIAKYSPTGSLIFAKMLDQTTNPQNQYSIDAFDLKIDNSNNIYVGGFTNSPSIDFDPSSNTALLGSTSHLGFIAKYDVNGNYLWVNRIIGTNAQTVRGCSQIAIDNFSNRIRVAGEVWNLSSSFNCSLQAYNGPNYSSSFNITSFVAGFSKGVFICTFDNNGNFINSTPDQNKCVSASTDPVISQTNGTNVCFGYTKLIGSNYTPILEFINASGVQGATPNLSANSSSSFLAMKNIMFDATNNYYITCNYRGDSYAVPSSTVTLPSNINEYNMGFIKMNSSHQGVWAKKIGNTSTSNALISAYFDPSKGLFAVGTFSGTIDFDFGAGVKNITTSNSGFTNNSFIINIDANGNYLSAGAIGGFNTSYVSSFDIERYDADNFIMCGAFTGKVDFDYYTNDTVYVMNPVTNNLSNFIGFVSKYYNCVSPPSSPLAISGNTVSCSTSSQTYSIALVPNTTSYNWLLPAGWVGTSTTNTILLTPSATGQLSVTAINNCGASLPSILNVSVNTTPSLSVNTTSNPICRGTSTTLSAIGASTYSWSNGSTTSSIVVTPTITTTYTVTGTNGTCIDSKSIIITVNPLPSVLVLATTNTLCSGQSTTLTCGGGVTTYTWSSGLQNLPLAVTPSITTTYSVTGTDANGCEKTTVKIITVNPTPTVSILSSNTNTICEGDNTTLTASGAITYEWQDDNSINPVRNETPTSSITYSVIGKSSAGCADTSNITVNVNALPTVLISASQNTICVGEASTLTTSGAQTYTWSNSSVGNSISASPIASTLYSVLGEDINGCQNSAAVTITVNPLPNVTITAANDSICDLESISLLANGASTYTWLNDGTIGSINLVSPGATTIYTVMASSSQGCSASTFFTLTVNSLPNVTASAFPSNTVCSNQQITLQGGGALSFVWSNNEGDSDPFYSPPGVFTHTVTGTDLYGCTNTAQITVTVLAIPSLEINSSNGNPICAGQSTTLTASGATSYDWADLSSTNPVRVVTPSSTTTYSLSGTDSNGCSSQMTFNVFVTPLPIANIISSDSLLCIGESATLTVTSGYNYLWLFNGAATNTVVVSPTSSTTYSVYVSDQGCDTTIVFNQIVDLCTGIDNHKSSYGISFFPNPFTNVINISNPYYEKLSIVMVNNLGQEVLKFITRDSKEFSTTHLSSGIYYMKIITENQESMLFKLIKN
jgi:hypothetical protein